MDDRRDFALLLQLLKERCNRRGKLDTQICKEADISPSYFSRLCSGERKAPSRETVICLAIGLELGVEGTNVLLQSADYAPLRGNQRYMEKYGLDPYGNWITELLDSVLQDPSLLDLLDQFY